MAEFRFSNDDMVWLLGAACQLHRIPFDAKLAVGQYPPPHSIDSLREALSALGLRNSLDPMPLDRLSTLSSICFVSMRLVDSEECRFVLLLHSDGERVLCISPGETEPRETSVADFGQGYAGLALRFALEAKTLRDSDDPENKRAPRPFGFRWFVPELKKHKTIWRDVLLASLSIQLVGLATPLFTQIVIDKVVVHQTMSTLTVIGVGLFVFMIFTSLMTWVRQYLVLHTGNRVDAVLGSRVFDHLLGLPPRYFEHRPTGILVARLHGVETLRDFITGAAVTLLLDLPFLFIFLAVMFYYSWQLSLIAVGLLGAVTALSMLAAPMIRERLNRQFLVGARNQAFVTEYLAGIETVKSLQMEPQLRRRYGEYLAESLATRD